MGEIAGHITVDGHSHMLEMCGKNCYAWVENDQLWKDEVGLESEEDSDNYGKVQKKYMKIVVAVVYVGV